MNLRNRISLRKIHYDLRNCIGPAEIRGIVKRYIARKVGYTPDLEHPRTFNEKINWYKLYYQDPLITRCCDKFAVKGYVSEVIGPEYTVPTLKSWTDADAVELAGLPEKFVLKVNWSSGFNIIVRDKAALDEAKAKRRLARWMQPYSNTYYGNYNWGYKHIRPVIYAEEYLDALSGQVCDYKLFFCGGEFAFMMVASDRKKDGASYAYYDKELRLLPFTRGGHPVCREPLPKHLERMKALGKQLAAPFPFVRVDFYELGDRICVGEMTFYTAGGARPFDPPEWDERLGALIPLPEKRILETAEPPVYKRFVWWVVSLFERLFWRLFPDQ